MRQNKGRLTQEKVDTLTTPGMHPDGRGLYLQVASATARSWLYRYTLHGRQRYLGLGSVAEVTLAKARDARDDARTLIRQGVDPVARRKEDRANHRAAERDKVTFKERAAQYIEAHADGWKNAKHRQQWGNTLETYVYPTIGDLPASMVTAGQIVDILRPIWTAKAETARRVRGRIEVILDYAADPDDAIWKNPAALTPQLAKKLPKLSKRKQRHFPALPYPEIPALMGRLRAMDSISAKALEFTILTAARTNETIGATESEIELGARVWTIPGERMKADEDHRVPLPQRAIDILATLPRQTGNPYLFHGGKIGKPLSAAAMDKLLKSMGYDGTRATVHGMRSSFRDWAAECTGFPREIAEKALAHAIGSETEAAYQRGDLLEKRHRLMEAWGTYCATPEGEKVVTLKRAPQARSA